MGLAEEVEVLDPELDMDDQDTDVESASIRKLLL